MYGTTYSERHDFADECCRDPMEVFRERVDRAAELAEMARVLDETLHRDFSDRAAAMNLEVCIGQTTIGHKKWLFDTRRDVDAYLLGRRNRAAEKFSFEALPERQRAEVEDIRQALQAKVSLLVVTSRFAHIGGMPILC